MIKTSSFLSIFLLLIFTFSLNIRQVSAEVSLGEISLPPSEKPQLQVSEGPKVFLPSKLIIGQDNIFVVQGEPGAKVSLAISSSNHGAKPLFGKKLRLGDTEQTIEAEISATGAVEIIYKLPEDKSLINKVKFFEVAIWKDANFNDIAIAKTMSSAGRETVNNGIEITTPPSTSKIPTFAPVIPGVGQEIIRTIEHIHDIKEGKVSPDLMDDGSQPAYLDSPEKTDVILQNINSK